MLMMVWCHPGSWDSSRRSSLMSTAMAWAQLAVAPAMIPARPTAPVPKMIRLQPACGAGEFRIVPEPVMKPHPRGQES
ncbi:hypothetical protein CRD60_03070 [Bifidobacterium aemilianum]|uniref:Uncharacterized protein n=1 Tax=Bifidobacterium aemilianum TaxID=2493120 RepID=A0A366K8T2_9BIFI|nr:hypothetical protein CRD60_03070 [Bifidobacterium aemilianum]